MSKNAQLQETPGEKPESAAARQGRPRPLPEPRPRRASRGPKPGPRVRGGAGAGSSAGACSNGPRWPAIWCLFIGLCFVAWLAYDLPASQRLTNTDRAPASPWSPATGRSWPAMAISTASRCKLDQLPPYLPDALLAIEDRRFYSHFGFDPLGLLRAIVDQYRPGHVVAGRQHHHPAAGQEPVPDVRPHAAAQGPGG